MWDYNVFRTLIPFEFIQVFLFMLLMRPEPQFVRLPKLADTNYNTWIEDYVFRYVQVDEKCQQKKQEREILSAFVYLLYEIEIGRIVWTRHFHFSWYENFLVGLVLEFFKWLDKLRPHSRTIFLTALATLDHYFIQSPQKSVMFHKK